jgi:sugar-specific transcriptional regulator TrmB
MPDRFIDTLSKMGLSVNEAKVYLALLTRSTSAVSEIVTTSRVPQKMIYYTLQKLMKRGLCTLVPGRVKRYRPTPPRLAIGDLIKKAQTDITLSRKMLVELQSQYETPRSEATLPEHMEVVQSTAQIVEHMLSLERAAAEEVLSFNKAPYAMSRRNEEELRGLARGVKYRTIYEISEVRTLLSRSVIEMYSEAGEEVRVVHTLPLKMMIFDRSTLMFALDSQVSSAKDLTAAIVRRSSLIDALGELFEVHWQKAMTLDEFRVRFRGSISLERKQPDMADRSHATDQDT